MIDGRVTVLAEKLAAAVDVQDDERKRSALRAGAIRLHQQTIHVGAAAEEAGAFVGNGERADEGAKARVVDGEYELIADGLQEEAFVGFPAAHLRRADDKRAGGELGFFVGEDDAQRGGET